MLQDSISPTLHCSEPLLQVLECWDRKRKDYVAVKIIRNIQVGGSC
jgi:hypothetical protein